MGADPNGCRDHLPICSTAICPKYGKGRLYIHHYSYYVDNSLWKKDMIQIIGNANFIFCRGDKKVLILIKNRAIFYTS